MEAGAPGHPGLRRCLGAGLVVLAGAWAAACAGGEEVVVEDRGVQVVGPASARAILVPGTFPTLVDAAAALPGIPASETALRDWESSWGSPRASSLRGGARTVLAGAAVDSVAARLVQEGLEAMAWLIPERTVTSLPQDLAVPVFQARRLLLEARDAVDSDLPQTGLLSYLTAADRILELMPRGKALAMASVLDGEIRYLEVRGGDAVAADREAVRERVATARTLIEAGEAEDALSVLVEARQIVDRAMAAARG